MKRETALFVGGLSLGVSLGLVALAALARAGLLPSPDLLWPGIALALGGAALVIVGARRAPRLGARGWLALGAGVFQVAFAVPFAVLAYGFSRAPFLGRAEPNAAPLVLMVVAAAAGLAMLWGAIEVGRDARFAKRALLVGGVMALWPDPVAGAAALVAAFLREPAR